MGTPTMRNVADLDGSGLKAWRRSRMHVEYELGGCWDEGRWDGERAFSFGD